MIVKYRAEASADMRAIYDYLNERSPSGAASVMSAILAGVRLIAQLPLSSPKTSRPGIRAKNIRRYRYKIFYQIEGDVIEIIHIRHTSRQPWA